MKEGHRLSRVECDVNVDALALDWVWIPDHSCLRDLRVQHHRALDLGGADSVAGHLRVSRGAWQKGGTGVRCACWLKEESRYACGLTEAGLRSRAALGEMDY